MHRRYDIPLLPLVDILQEEEVKRAARARKERRKKVKKIPCRYLSVNRMYAVIPKTSQRRLSKEGKLFKEYIGEQMKLIDEARDWGVTTFEFFDCTYVFFMTPSMFFYKNGDAKTEDVSNFLKGTEDAVFDHLLEDDKYVVSIHGHKRLCDGPPKLVVLVSEASYTDSIWHQGVVGTPTEWEVGEGVYQSII